MWECSKSILRRLSDSRFATRYFVGYGIDIGCGPDCLDQYYDLFPLMTHCDAWDLEDGDAQYMIGQRAESFDFVHSSHCLEHLTDPFEALWRWYDLLKPGGHMVVVVPDFHLYEHGQWPSRYNPDHKFAFTLKSLEGNDHITEVLFLLRCLPETAQVLKVELLDATYRPTYKDIDQTLTPVGECAIEFIVRKEDQSQNATTSGD